MKNFILAIALATTISTAALACPGEGFRIGTCAADRQPQPSDCQVLHKGDAAGIAACVKVRQDGWKQFAH